MVNAGPYIGSAFIGCWISDPVNNYFGRRGVSLCYDELEMVRLTTTPGYLHRGTLLCSDSHRWCVYPVMGTAFCYQAPHGHWYGSQRIICTDIRRRELACQDPWCAGYVLADVVRLRCV